MKRLIDSPIVDKVETRLVSVPLARAFRGSHYQLTSKTCLFTRVHAGEIIGEAYAEVSGAEAGGAEVAGVILKSIGPRLCGQPLDSTERLWREYLAATKNSPSSRAWNVRSAVGAVDAAVWDAIGKAWQMPLWRLWGGFRSHVDVMWIAGYYGSDIASDMQLAMEGGARAIKFKVGGRSPAEDAKRFLEAFALKADGVVMAADANYGWSAREAAQFVRHVGAEKLRWFEEPSRLENSQREWRDIRLGSGVSVCAGQTELSSTRCLDLISYGSIDVCNFDAIWGGGPTEWLRVAGIAAAANCELAHHQQVAVGAHLLAAVAEGTYAEIFAPERDPIWWNGVRNRPNIVDGRMELPTSGGFGWDYDWKWLDGHVLEAGTGHCGRGS